VSTWVSEFREKNLQDVAQNIVLIGNKCDLEINREVSEQEGRMLGERLDCNFFETSAKNDLNIDHGFECIVEIAIDSMLMQ
jgi:GTPase SAR1 family protein